MNNEIETKEGAAPTPSSGKKPPAYGCSAGDQPSDRRSREMRRVSREPDYQSRMKKLFGEEVRGIKVLPRGAVVYFKDGGQLRDDGVRFAVSHMTEADAARRLVKSALDRGWTSAVFTGSDQFLREAFRDALDNGLDIHPTNSHQARILAEVKASFSKPAIHASPSIGPSPSTIAGPGEGFKPRLDALRRSRQEMEEQFTRNRAPRNN